MIVSEILVVDVAKVVGPVFIGNILNWMFMGTLVMQLYTYYQNFPSDRILIRILVYGLFLVDVAQTVILTFHGWFFAVSAWGNPATFDVIPWSGPTIPVLCGLIAATVQIFYAWRIWIITTNRFLRSVAILIVLVALTQSLAGMISGLPLLKNSSPENQIRWYPGVLIWFAGSLLADVLVTACMTYILARAKKRTFWATSETMLTTLINRVVQSGAVTSVCAAVDLALFAGIVDTNFHFVPSYILGKLYTNSLMLTLNLRRPTYQIPDVDLMPMSGTRAQDVSDIPFKRTTHVEGSTPDNVGFWTQKVLGTDNNEHHLHVNVHNAA
ncbi:hypothetical protein C8R45DRAFT_873174 [Mycena sanguinolenta]|nr:hypothetical protein C8R45DRAFT_873174 [Mycena sanguinolenta]